MAVLECFINMAANRKIQSTQHLTRQGEGVEVEITSRSQPQSSNGTTVYGLDFSRAQVPDRRYVADVANLILRGGTAHFLFAQARVAGSGLRSLLDVQMSVDSLKNVAASLEPFKQLRAKKTLEYSELTTISDEPEQTVGLAATSMVGSAAGHEACLDFYYMSPFALGQLSQTGRLFADPVVRISLPESLMNTLVRAVLTATGEPVEGPND